MINFAVSGRTFRKPGAFAFMLTPLRNRRYSFAHSCTILPQAFAFDPYLFLRPDHLASQGPDELTYLQLLDHKTDRIVAHFPVFCNTHHGAYSPGRASFGGIQLASGLLPGVLTEFLNRAHAVLREMAGGAGIFLKLYPLGHAPAEATQVVNALVRLGYQVSCSEVNHHIPVSEMNFDRVAYPAARRRLSKCRKAGFRFQEEDPGMLPEAFAFIRHCRAEKGHQLSLTFEALADLFERYPQDFRIFSVRTQAQELAACTIAVRINNEVLYNFYPASPLRFNNFSPAVMLAEGLYNICQLEGFCQLDLGTSALPEGPNFPLMNFKKHLGGQPSLKLHFSFRG